MSKTPKPQPQSTLQPQPPIALPGGILQWHNEHQGDQRTQELHIDTGRRRPRWRPSLFEREDEEQP